MSFALGKGISSYFDTVNFGASTSNAPYSDFFHPASAANLTQSGLQSYGVVGSGSGADGSVSDYSRIFDENTSSLSSASWGASRSGDIKDISQPISQSEEPYAPSLEPIVESASEEAVSGLSGLTTNFLAFGASQGIKELNDFQNASNLKEAQIGTGPGGHAFDAVNRADIQNNFNTFTHGLESTAISLGSAFGPEGLALGAGVAGAISLGSSAFTPSMNTTPTNSGSMIDTSTLNNGG